MARSGSDVGTVVRWEPDRGTGLVELPDVPGECLVEAAALHPSARGALRAGQVVEVEWTADEDDRPLRAVRVTPRDDLQATPGA